MPRRFGRPGLVGTMARTAVVAGTATAVAGGVSRRQQGRADQKAAEQQAAADQQYQEQAAAEQQYQQQAQPAPAPAADDLGAQIERLSSLKTAGVISEAEFSAAKAKLLGI